MICFMYKFREVKDFTNRSLSASKLFAEHEHLELIVKSKDTCSGNTSQNVGTSTLEERKETFLSHDD